MTTPVTGRAVVRSVVQGWFDPAGVLWEDPPDYLDAVWTSFPAQIDFRQYARVADIPTRAQAVVLITGQNEKRASIGGENQGWKYVTFSVVVQFFVESVQPEPDAAMDDLDTIADGMKARAVADHTFGQDPSVIFKAAEDGVSMSFGEPRLNAYGATEMWFQLSFDVNTFYQA